MHGRFEKGHIPWNTGKKRPSFSKETLLKMSESQKGRIFSPEHRAKISARMKLNNPMQNPECRAKVSRTQKGNRYHFGYHHSLEVKQQLSISHTKHKFCIMLNCQNTHCALGLCQMHYDKQYRENNPHSSDHFSIDLQLAMGNVRKRDNNTCQWYGCRLTHRQAPNHVHHIFPRSEYPELELVEQYMICYCANHHGMFHYYRGDKSHHILGFKVN